jgi:hypothetical protein
VTCAFDLPAVRTGSHKTHPRFDSFARSSQNSRKYFTMFYPFITQSTDKQPDGRANLGEDAQFPCPLQVQLQAPPNARLSGSFPNPVPLGFYGGFIT